MTTTGWSLFGIFVLLTLIICGYFVFKPHRKGEAEEGMLEAILQDLHDLWSDLFCPIGRFFWRPFTDAYKVATGHPEVLPAREAIGWLAGISIITYLAVASAIYTESWWLMTLFIALFIVLHTIRTYIWSIVDAFQETVQAVNEYLGDDPS
ncbi:MAG: hypothetical protein AAB899_04850 [Patescibacteria group bacterium]